jgi:hypothetical protein
VPSLVVLVLLLIQPRLKLKLLPEGAVARLLLVFLLAGPLFTSVLNGDRILAGPRLIPEMTLYDALSLTLAMMLNLVPFLIGRAMLADPKAHREILRAFCIGGLAYSIPMLLEVRLSPQLHILVYGFFPQSFMQQVRFDGYRPVVFLKHGLWVAFFTLVALIATAALWRSTPKTGRGVRDRSRLLYALAVPYLAVLLVLCKSIGALVLGVMALPVVLLMGARMQVRIAAILALLVLSYPVLRAVDLVPDDRLRAMAGMVSESHAGSLGLRLTNDAALMDRAMERPVFGWGTWGRNRVHDPETGADLSITDSYWMIIVGSFGWIGFIGTFGLLAWPVAQVWWRDRGKVVVPRETAALCLIVVINAVYLVPNSAQSNWLWLMAGGLLGYAEQVRRVRRSGVGVPEGVAAGAANLDRLSPAERRRQAKARGMSVDPVTGAVRSSQSASERAPLTAGAPSRGAPAEVRRQNRAK